MATPSELQLNIRVTHDLKDALDRLVEGEAERTGYRLGRSEVVRRVLEIVLTDGAPLNPDELRTAVETFRRTTKKGRR